MNFKFSSFSILIGFICLSIIGASLIPLINIQLTPSKKQQSIHVNYYWQDASAKVIEHEVTSKLERFFNTVKGIEELSSISDKGQGQITIKFKNNTNMDAIRFELANLIRQSYTSLPDGVSYPSLSLSAVNENKTPFLSYSINAKGSLNTIKTYTENHIAPKLSTIIGVNQVNVYGATPFEWTIKYNTNTLLQLNLTINDIQSAIKSYLQNKHLGTGVFKPYNAISEQNTQVILTSKDEVEINWNSIPIKKIGSRIIYLKNIAEVKYKTAAFSSYYRINGLNTINIALYAKKI